MARLRKVAKAVQGSSTVVIRSDGVGLRKLQCVKCTKQVPRSLDSQGKPIYRCSCGASFRSVTM